MTFHPFGSEYFSDEEFPDAIEIIAKVVPTATNDNRWYYMIVDGKDFVTCKDCTHRQNGSHCDKLKRNVEDSFYCGYAERR